MEPNKSEESGEMYSPDNQGEYATEVGALSFSVQGLSDALTALETDRSATPTLQLEVMMADHPGVHALLHFHGTWAWFYMCSRVILP